MRPFAASWVAATVALTVAVARGQHAFDGAALGLLGVALVPTVLLIRWLGLPVLSRGPIRHRTFAISIAVAVATLVGLYVFLGRPGALIAIAAVAGGVTWWVRARLTTRDVGLAAVLGVAALLAGLGAEWTGLDTRLWAMLQLPLTTLGLLAGWGLLRGTELDGTPAARALVLSDGAGAAARAVLLGAAIAVPWALVNVAIGAASRDTWARAPWQVLLAAQPAVAEEAWARVFLVAVVYLVLRRGGSARAALVGAILVAGYWFAWLHAHEFTVSALVTTMGAGTLFSLPLMFVWLRRGLESAIAFHFVIDATRYGFAYLANAGLI